MYVLQFEKKKKKEFIRNENKLHGLIKSGRKSR